MKRAFFCGTLMPMTPGATHLTTAQRATPPARRWYVARALLLSAVWVIGTLPAALGVQQCPSARLFHVACPGCGMSRAMHLWFAGDVAGALAMHALALPIVLGTCALGAATVVAVLVRGTPAAIVESRAGRALIAAFVLVNAASIALWVLRLFGLFGGPPPV